jgi:hypothetical protein
VFRRRPRNLTPLLDRARWVASSDDDRFALGTEDDVEIMDVPASLQMTQKDCGMG